ncbi:MAG: TetR/AcrR family transcriptional regulator [Deltaproteobacteria bacterium]|nr:MAG: TetR/AcrR family transcriptional regulator [Deltaproteobacteria bacterium]
MPKHSTSKRPAGKKSRTSRKTSSRSKARSKAAARKGSSARGRGAQKAKRAYHSPLREQQMEQTRQLIVDALIEQVWKEGVSDFSVPKVARRAGVSTRTVYRYFPTRDDLLEAISEEMVRRVKEPAPPTDPAELAEFIPVLYRFLDENRAMVEAALRTQLAGEVRDRMRSRRLARMKAALGEELSRLEEKEARQLVALLRVLGGSTLWRELTTTMGLSNDEAAELMRWAYQAVLDAIGIRRGEPLPEKMPWTTDTNEDTSGHE